MKGQNIVIPIQVEKNRLLYQKMIYYHLNIFRSEDFSQTLEKVAQKWWTFFKILRNSTLKKKTVGRYQIYVKNIINLNGILDFGVKGTATKRSPF